MNTTKFILPFCMVVLFPFLMFAQEQNSKFETLIFSDSSLSIVTNRTNDDFSDDCILLKNSIDHDNPLKIYEFNYSADSIYCNRIRVLTDYKTLLETDNDWLIFVHGDGQTLLDAAISALKTQNLHHVKVLLFSWPSKMREGNGAKNFKNSKNNVALGTYKFRELLVMLQQFKKQYDWPKNGRHLSLFFHSLGNLYLERAVKDSLLAGLDNDLFDNLIINAAAVNEYEHAKWVDKLNIQKNIYIISNKWDFNLNGARVFTSSGKQLGERLKLPLSAKANYINFSNAVGLLLPTSASHTYFFGKIPNKSENIKEFYTALFHGKTLNLSDTTLYTLRKDGLGYDILFE